MEFLIHSDLHLRVLKSKLIPELYKFVDIARGELAYGWAIDVPQSSGKLASKGEKEREIR